MNMIVKKDFQRIYAKRDISGKYLDGKHTFIDLLKEDYNNFVFWSIAHTNDKINDKNYKLN